MSEPTSFRGRAVCLSPEDWRLFSEALREKWPEARYYAGTTYQQDRRPDPPDIGLSSSLFDHCLPARHTYPSPEYQEWRGEAKMVFDPDWQPHWHRSRDGESWSLWPPRHPQVLFQFGCGLRYDKPQGYACVDDGNISFYCNPVEKEHFRLAARFFRVLAKFATNRNLVYVHFPDRRVEPFDNNYLWAGHDAIRWVREDPDRFLGIVTRGGRWNNGVRPADPPEDGAV